MHTPVLYHKRVHLPTPRTPPEQTGPGLQLVWASMQSPLVCLVLYGGNGQWENWESLNLPVLFWAFTKWVPEHSATPSPHTPPPKEVDPPDRQFKLVRSPLDSITTPLLPSAAPVGFSLIIASPWHLCLFLFHFPILSLPSPTPNHLDLSPASMPITLGLYPHSPPSSASTLCKVPLGRKKHV